MIMFCTGSSEVSSRIRGWARERCPYALVELERGEKPEARARKMDVDRTRWVDPDLGCERFKVGGCRRSGSTVTPLQLCTLFQYQSVNGRGRTFTWAQSIGKTTTTHARRCTRKSR